MDKAVIKIPLPPFEAGIQVTSHRVLTDIPHDSIITEVYPDPWGLNIVIVGTFYGLNATDNYTKSLSVVLIPHTSPEPSPGNNLLLNHKWQIDVRNNKGICYSVWIGYTNPPISNPFPNQINSSIEST